MQCGGFEGPSATPSKTFKLHSDILCAGLKAKREEPVLLARMELKLMLVGHAGALSVKCVMKRLHKKLIDTIKKT